MRKILITSTLLLTIQAQAYLTINDTAEILPKGFYSVGVEPQLNTSENTGLNLGVFVDAPLTEASQARLSLGTGVTDFWASVAFKYIPYPDVDNQPAIGLRGSLTYGRDGDLNFFHTQFAPMASKKTPFVHGLLIPYVALPITHNATKAKNFVSSQFTLGSEFIPKANKDFHYGAEIGFNLNQSFSYISAFVTMPFDGALGYRR